MELSLAVTSSLSHLVQKNIYCTEPWRIPLAGKLDTCCFDKTGTLTSDEMRLRGLRLPPPPIPPNVMATTLSNAVPDEYTLIPCMDGTKHGSNADLVSPSTHLNHIPIQTLRNMISCHTLAYSKHDEQLIGDPLEKAVLQGCGYTLKPKNNLIVIPLTETKSSLSCQIMHRWTFESKLKRMTVIAKDTDKDDIYVLTKGAPEVIKNLLEPSSIPPNYDQVYRHHMSLGQRVLATAQKPISKFYQKNKRCTYEYSLQFSGFLIFDCPIKFDTFPVLNELKASSHRVVMITGDAALTAAEVGRQVGIIDTSPVDTYELRELKRKATEEEESAFVFVPITATAGEYTPEQTIAFLPSNIPTLLRMVSNSEIALCVSGEVLTKLALSAVKRAYYAKYQKVFGSSPKEFVMPPDGEKGILMDPSALRVMKLLVPIVSIFARHAPRQKEAVIEAFNWAGSFTLMCGDGTNDVGALKKSHCGVSIVSVPSIEAAERETKTLIAQQRKTLKKHKKSKTTSTALRHSLHRLAETQKQLDAVALGDASIASPFTSKTVSIACCKHIIQQGRCTLVTMLQIYKILGVNCLVNALVLSKLHMHGVKQGDRQLTVIGVVIAALFFFVTKGKPLSSLSAKRPPSSIMCMQAFSSIICQFLIHFVSIVAVTHMSLAYLDPDDPSMVPDGPFHPNTLNTSSFIMTVLASVNTFVNNYRGRPFVQSLSENKLLYRSAQFFLGLLFISASEVFEPLNQLLQLSPLPSKDSEVFEEGEMNFVLEFVVGTVGFKATLCAIMVLDSVLSFKIEKGIVRYFEGN